MSVKIYHNPRCSKSRQTLALLQDKGIEPVIVEYLKNSPNADEIANILNKMNAQPRDIMRTREQVYKDLGLADESISNEQLIKAMVDNPILIERPIVITDKGACVCRPPESVKIIL